MVSRVLSCSFVFAISLSALCSYGNARAQLISPRCAAAMDRAAGHYSKCLLLADAHFARHGDATTVDHKHSRCRTRFERRTTRAVARYGVDECASADLVDAIAIRTASCAEGVAVEAGGAKAPSVLYVQNGTGATLSESSLTLSGVTRQTLVTWFADRPYRDAGQMTVEEFLSLFSLPGRNSFTADPPNADLTCSSVGDPVNYVVTLTEPVLDEAAQTLTYTVTRVLPPAPGSSFPATCGSGVALMIAAGGAKPGIPGERPPCDSAVPRVDTAEGPVCGVAQANREARAWAYLGIPFAAPPVNELRWRDPELAAERDGLFRATEVGALCPTPGPGEGAIVGEEDCLYLNVFTPVSRSSKLRPVLFYIPGGGFVSGGGSTNSFNGTYMAGAGDVVVVTMNYRLGALGFLRYMEGGGGISGNFGIKDQISAMKWVRHNIASFGGDPEKVTLFGESAGAMSNGLHLFSIPESDDLFRAAIMESNVMSVPYADATLAAERGAQFVEASICTAPGAGADCPGDDAWLRALPVETVIAAQDAAMPPGGMPGLLVNGMALGMLWAPTIGVSPVVGQAYEGFHPGSSPKPYVFGFNRNEGFFFVPSPESITPGDYDESLECDFGAEQAARIKAFTVHGSRPYNPASYSEDPVSGMSAAAQALAWAITDYAFAAGNLRSAQNAWEQMDESDLSMHGYYFTQVSSFNFTGVRRCAPASGHVCHTEELPYVFHNMLKKVGENFVPADHVTSAEEKLARRMSLTWSRFARNPFGKKGGWGRPALQAVSEGPYVEWGTPVSTVNDLGRMVNYELWSTIRPVPSKVALSCSP